MKKRIRRTGAGVFGDVSLVVLEIEGRGWKETDLGSPSDTARFRRGERQILGR